jgi:hypothetical protein
MQRTPTVVRPTYDRDHYLARAGHYARDAAHEPDPVVRKALQALERECRRKAEKTAAFN